MFKQIIQFLATPGFKGAIEEAAPTQHVMAYSGSGVENPDVPKKTIPFQNVTGYVEKVKKNRLDRYLDNLVKASGSEIVFLFMVCGLLAWAITGIWYGEEDKWAAMISDIQAIVSYLFDSLLMRQQLNGYERHIRVSASLRSRTLSQKQMFRQLLAENRFKKSASPKIESSLPSEFSPDLPTESWVGKASNYFAVFLGHFATISMYWVCIFIWIGFGQYCDWSDRWQLYINSSTSALMILIFAFLANIRERHDEYIEKCLNAIFEVDSAVELKLRTQTGDGTPNPIVVVPGPVMSRIQRAIFYYADVIGTLVGVTILIVVIIVWVCIGPVMMWNDNWWLLIGTYAGLVGLVDGFVLRNVQSRFHEYEDDAFEEVKLEDVGILAEISMEEPEETDVQPNSINHRLSAAMGVICAHEITVILGVFLVIGLIIGASAMKWTTTGQLLCNIPPSIIESFFMMILITGHTLSEDKRRLDLHKMYLRRLKLLAYVNGLDEDQNTDATTIAMPGEA